jgi:ectoine hydroxylase-related dioxygenase (phytanoyl-CoA dioxygenase family)
MKRATHESMTPGEPMIPTDPDPLDDAVQSHLAEEVEDQGFAVREGVIPVALREALVARIDELMVELAIPVGENAFLGRHTRRIFNLLARDSLFERTPVFSRTLPVVDRVLDEECLLSSLTAIEMSPGQDRQPLHSDDGSYGFVRPSPTLIVVAMWALTDFTLANGATHVVPGSHRADRRPRRGDDPDTIQVEMPAGSVLFYSGSLWHGGGENRSSDRRMGIVNNYCAGFLRQEESQLLALARSRVASYPPRLRKLVGYGTYRGLLGHVDQRNPESLVDPEARTDMIWSKIGRP